MLSIFAKKVNIIPFYFERVFLEGGSEEARVELFEFKIIRREIVQ